ncbi:lactoylglutathione lyase [Neptunomonas japonica]|uniref:lactoylglutathione lyase n=1 Tax=Neptunomonas japonica JAMM 1380 TaxID=1441457 RepID=A0A7R6PC35_9GAMM|nr:lactoylglutathione lyase [Neptunomonas japonica]BBB31023.1 lactoylglutathione lyase [Neptunomonas japonica JAMM 1380]
MRLLHTMLRVTDLNKSVDFYTKTLEMKLLRQQDYPQGRFTLAFLGYGDESQHTALELTHNWDTDHYELGNAYGHIAIEVEDVYQACETIKVKGGEVVREAGPMKSSTSGTILAFVKDPDGYMIELLSPKRLD